MCKGAEVNTIRACNIVQHNWYEGGSVTIWGGLFVLSRRDHIVIGGNLTSLRNINEVLEPVVLPFLQQHRFEYPDDNARPHRAGIVLAFFRDDNILRIDWPAKSQNTSPIEDNLAK